jgi:hypothetical protein
MSMRIRMRMRMIKEKRKRQRDTKLVDDQEGREGRGECKHVD